MLRRLQADPGSPARDAGIGLHFDLTVPFARYVLENAGKLEFPFRRYQIQKVWRGERPQEGRYREFTQADIDVVGRDELPFHHDVEVARVMAEALAAAARAAAAAAGQQPQADPGLLRAASAPPDVAAVMRVVDKLDKVPGGAVADAARRRGGTRPRSRPSSACASPTIRSPDTSFVDAGPRARRQHELLDEGLDELAAVVEGCASVGGDRVSVEADLRIARGLDYYTGTVFETVHGGLRGARLDLLRRAVRRPGHRRPHDVPRRRHLPRRQPDAGAAAGSAAT